MDIHVCVKQIPGPEVTPSIDPETKTLVRAHPFVLDEADMHGVELALRLVESSGGGDVVLVSMVPENETEGLRTGLAMGAAKAVLISDPALVGSDALSTAKVLAAAMRHLQARLVIASTESSEGYTGTVPVQIAELLSWPALSFVSAVELRDGELVARRQTDLGFDEIVCDLPAVMSVTAGAVEVRYPTLRGIMGARAKPVEQLSLADLDLAPSEVGAGGARQQVLSLEPIVSARRGEVLIDDGNAQDKILALLEQWRLI